MSAQRQDPELTPEILLRAYSIGLFPMAESADDPELFWVQPELRGIIPLDGFHVSRSLAKMMRKSPFDIRVNSAFRDVMLKCGEPANDRPICCAAGLMPPIPGLQSVPASG